MSFGVETVMLVSTLPSRNGRPLPRRRRLTAALTVAAATTIGLHGSHETVAGESRDPPTASTSDGSVVVPEENDGRFACPPLYVADPFGAACDDDGVVCFPSDMGCAGGTTCRQPHGCAVCRPRWFASASGLVMTRTLPAAVPVSTRAGDVVLTSSAAAADWPGGVDLRVGRWLGQRRQHGIEAIYWGLYNIGSASSVDGGSLDAIPTLAPSIDANGTAASGSFESTSSQSVARNDLVNDVEINWLYVVGSPPELLDEQQRVSWLWLAGFRFFQLEDTLTLTSPWGAVDPLIFSLAANNNLFGGQVGGRFDWRFARQLRLAAVPKFMLAGNSVTNTSLLATTNGIDATFDSGDVVGSRTTASTFAYLGSVDGLVAWDVTDRWSLWIGYRVVGVGNIMQADAVWPVSISTASSLQAINTNSSTVVHGGFAGFEGRY